MITIWQTSLVLNFSLMILLILLYEYWGEYVTISHLNSKMSTEYFRFKGIFCIFHSFQLLFSFKTYDCKKQMKMFWITEIDSISTISERGLSIGPEIKSKKCYREAEQRRDVW